MSSQRPDESPAPAFDPTESMPSMRAALTPAPPRAAHDESGNALPVGTYLGEFEIRGVAGEGGFSIVYRAWDHSLKRAVAIKEYMPATLALRSGSVQVSVRSERHAEPFFAGLRSFVEEARLLAQFDHPGLVRVYRFWEANGSAYMVMPFYEGQTLREELAQHPQGCDEATLLGWIGTVADALSVIHTEHWYHRDIAPDNILLLAGSKRPLLLDFGAARQVIGDMTQALTVILKPGYAPVEQYAEIPGMKQGPWTDVYALAAVAHYALRGRTPPPSVGRLVNDSYEPLHGSALAGRYGNRFLAAVDRALAVRPDRRTQSIAEFKADLGLPPPPTPGPEGARLLSEPPPEPVPPPPGMADLPLELVPVSAMVTAPLSARADEHTLRLPPLVSPPPSPPPPAARAAEAASPPAVTADPGLRRAALALGVLAVVGVAAYLGLRSPAPPAATPPPAQVVRAAAEPAPAPTVDATAPPSPPPLTTPVAAPVAAGAMFDAGAEFARVAASATPGWGLGVALDSDRLRIGRDKLSFRLTSAQAGWVYVFLHGPDGSLMQLYPNALTPPPQIEAGATLALPQGALDFDASEPAGRSRMLVMVSRHPRDHASFAPREEGGFTTFPTGMPAAVLASAHLGRLPLIAGSPRCAAGGDCRDDFGAVLAGFEVVP